MQDFEKKLVECFGEMKNLHTFASANERYGFSLMLQDSFLRRMARSSIG